MLAHGWGSGVNRGIGGVLWGVLKIRRLPT